MIFSCKNKIILVIGGTRGIGRAAVLTLADVGATVIVTGRALELAETVAAEARARGAEAFAWAMDIGDPHASRTAIDAIAARFGRIDALVANAGISPYWIRSDHITPEIWDELMAVNLRGTFFAVQAAGRHMLTQGSGSIVTVSSVTATVGVNRGLPYVATKGGLDAMIRTLAIEWADRGVRVNGVAPGYVATDLTHGMRNNPGITDHLLGEVPMGRFAEPEELAGTIVHLCSDAASFITGQIFVVDGGFAAGRAKQTPARI
ncbi:SDR family NAD(P)-dependent oxidoreductase [Rhizorhabdus sp.]|uniref:SDR family NAD(P)-dependent oxidoreductase n=1 Tax=Rhizorhabdus sp. TaxID=1968843 RepID=UPI0019A72D13|nr:SDR family NAD(P)-dependent oxidoreductase [Rhizorhabdus sp.]MBD3759252.1 SDR family oxidoreductase [Rhizorhabdus sp.]